MNNVTPQKKERVMKSLAILGLLGIIIFVAWVSIQIVSIFPSAIQSLASLADSVYNHDKSVPEITLASNTTSTQSGETFLITWDNVPTTGTYTLTYACTDGLLVKIKSADSNFEGAKCDTPYTLGLVNETSVIVSSSKKSVENFVYTIAYFKKNSQEETVSATHTVVVHNPKLVIVATDTDKPIVPGTEQVSTTTPTSTPIVTTPKPTVPTSTPTTTVTTKPVKPTYTYEYVYTIPVSDPNGYSDLKLTYLGIGKLNSNGTFNNTGELEKGRVGAIQFSVQNIGTKTSTEWNFEADLPGDASYESKDQEVLKPNERAILVISFPAIDDTKPQTFSLKVDGGNDTNSKNDSITWSTKVTN